MLDAIKLPIAALAGAMLMAMPAYLKGRADGRALEAADNAAITQKAIGELSNAADQARVMRRLCVERGLVWDFGTSVCREG